MAEIYNRTLVETKAAMLLITQSARVLAKNTGVLVLNDSARGKRRYRTVRIPASVAERLHRRLTKVV